MNAYMWHVREILLRIKEVCAELVIEQESHATYKGDAAVHAGKMDWRALESAQEEMQLHTDTALLNSLFPSLLV